MLKKDLIIVVVIKFSKTRASSLNMSGKRPIDTERVTEEGRKKMKVKESTNIVRDAILALVTKRGAVKSV